MRKLMLTSFLAVMAVAPVHAADKADEKPVPAAVQAPSNPHMDEMNSKARKLAASLSEEEAMYFAVVRENFGILRSIDVARGSVKEAVAQCADKNPDLKDGINARYKEWDKAITGATGPQQKAMDKAVTKDHFSDPAPVKDYLGTIDKAARFADDKMEKTVVTTPEACHHLMDSMGDTQETILQLVNGMAWSVKESGGKKEGATP